MQHDTLQYPFLKDCTRPRHYFGEDYYDTYEVYGITRDSSLLEQSNMAVLKKSLPSAFVTRARHWLCGWVDTLRIDQDASHEELERANKLMAALELYPILNEEEYSNRQHEAIYAYWQGASEWERRDLCRSAKCDARRIAANDMPDDVYDYLSERIY